MTLQRDVLALSGSPPGCTEKQLASKSDGPISLQRVSSHSSGVVTDLSAALRIYLYIRD